MRKNRIGHLAGAGAERGGRLSRPETLPQGRGAAVVPGATGILLILDEVQAGMGRCGTLLAEQNYGVRADILTLEAKAWAGVCHWLRCWRAARLAVLSRVSYGHHRAAAG